VACTLIPAQACLGLSGRAASAGCPRSMRRCASPPTHAASSCSLGRGWRGARRGKVRERGPCPGGRGVQFGGALREVVVRGVSRHLSSGISRSNVTAITEELQAVSLSSLSPLMHHCHRHPFFFTAQPPPWQVPGPTTLGHIYVTPPFCSSKSGAVRSPATCSRKPPCSAPMALSTCSPSHPPSPVAAPLDVVGREVSRAEGEEDALALPGHQHARLVERAEHQPRLLLALPRPPAHCCSLRTPNM